MKDTGYNVCHVISDITAGTVYKQLMKKQNFLLGQNNTNLTVKFNTDCINHHKPWSIFLAINEISPKLRFVGENVLLAEKCQGKGKPPFHQFLQGFSETKNRNGLVLNVDDQEVTVKVMNICGTSDLLTNPSVLNMTLFNGYESCITSEGYEYIGTIVFRGKGHSRCFPHRLEDERFPLRTDESVRKVKEKSSDKKRCKEFKGKSGLFTFKGIQYSGRDGSISKSFYVLRDHFYEFFLMTSS